jgi:hypothetical protein
LVIGVVVVSGAFVAVLHDRGSDGGDAEAAPQQLDEEEKGEWTHHYPAEYVGPVWITVDASDAAPRSLVIRWGVYQRRVHHETGDPTIYVFAKDAVDTDGESVLTTIHVDPAAVVTFDQGPNPPVGSEDVNGDWELVDED